jgi:uncharacterized protein YwgA
VTSLGDLGKTKLQKLTYFLQEAFGLPLGYRFQMYHYGPYSFDLDDELSRTKTLGYVDVEPDPDGYGFHILPINTAPETPGSYAERVEAVVERFGHLDAGQLELLATLHFVQITTQVNDEERVMKLTQSLKPKYPFDRIRDSSRQLKELLV